MYNHISDKVVGTLIRARRHKLVEFEGEMLYQGQDNNKPVTLIKSLSDICDLYANSNDPAACLATTKK